MAFIDGSGRLCGDLSIEHSKGSKGGSFKPRYFILDKEDEKLKIYYDSPNNLPKTACTPCKEIPINYISMVADARKTRPKAGFVFSITEAGEQLYIQARTEDDMLLWIEELNESCKITVPVTEQRTVVPGATITEIVGGIPITIAQENSDSGEDSMELSLPALSLPSIMSGYATKQGAVRKNWKKRFFVLDQSGLSYYKADQDNRPIKTIPLDDIVEAKLVNRQHHPHRLYMLEVVTASRTFNIQCETLAECVNWTKELTRHARGGYNAHTQVSKPTDFFCKSTEARLRREETKSSRTEWTEDDKQLEDRTSTGSAKKKSWLLW